MLLTWAAMVGVEDELVLSTHVDVLVNPSMLYRCGSMSDALELQW